MIIYFCRKIASSVTHELQVAEKNSLTIISINNLNLLYYYIASIISEI